MIDWREYWKDFPRRFGGGDFCRQVGRTANGGEPTPAPELKTVIEEASSLLKLGPQDRLLDLCCGNGLLTARFAGECKEVVGIDFSEPMIRIASEHHSGPNIQYIEGSVLDLDQYFDAAAFDKICMVESLAYFGRDDLGRILHGVAAVGAPNVALLFSGVLDDEAKASFFNTPERRAAYEQQKREGKEIMGRWWTRPEIVQIAAQQGYLPEFSSQDALLNTAHYRFNVVMRRG
jgi:cyclopropane fatty-acyl-phospholipid synthase-like methyltransferase